MDLAAFLLVSPFLVWISVVTARVEPPTNATLHCRSLNNVLEWRYDQLTPGLRFRVDIGVYYELNAEGFRNVTWVDPPALQADVSFLSDPAEAYQLTVTAVIGDSESDPSPSEDGITFSYDQDAPVDHKCFVDLPSVNVTAQPDDRILLRFEHPWLLYHKKLPGNRKPKPRKKKSHDAQIREPLPVFDYEVVIINQKQGHHLFSCEERVCERMLPVDATQDKRCVKIEGELTHMLVKGNQEYCALPIEALSHDYIYIYIYIVFGVLGVFTVALVCYMVYHKKTTPSTPLPSSMKFNHPTAQQALGPVHESVKVLEVEPASPTPLLMATEEEDVTEFTPARTCSPDYDLRMPIGVPSENEGVSDVTQVAQPNDEGSGYMQGNSLDEDETLASDEAPSGYERRAVVVALGPDELTEGYRH